MIVLSKKTLLVIMFCVTLALASSMHYYKKLIKKYEKNLKEKIISELREEIREIVSDELAFVKKASGDNKKYSQSLNQKIRAVLNQELESYMAGELDQGPVLPGGIKKPSNTINKHAKHLPQAQAGRKSTKGNRSDDLGDEAGAVSGKQDAIERTLVEKGGMLLRRGQLQIEPSFTTAHFSSNRINIEGFSILPVLVIGEISTEKVQRDIFISNLSLKYGLLHNLQGEIKFPHRYEFDRVTNNLGVEYTRKRGGVGDIELALSRQIAYARGLLPDALLSLGVKTITGGNPYNRDIGLGTGHWGVRTGLVLVKTSDPAVVFGSLGYTYNITRKIEDFGKVVPGNTASYGLGTVIALSYQTAITFQFQHDVTFKMKKDGIPVNGSFLNAASLKTGFNWSLSKSFSVDFSVSHGLTSDAPDYVVEIRFPFTF